MNTGVRLRSALNKSGQEKKDVVLVIDDSGSISDPDFAMMKTACETLVMLLRDANKPDNTRFSAVAFHCTSKIIAYLQQDPGLVCTAIHNYPRIKGSTNLIAGLTSAKTVLSGARFDAKKIVFVLTDGVANSDPYQTAFELKAQNVTVFAIGIGSGIQMNNLSKFGSFGCCFHMDNFSQLQNELTSAPGEKISERAVQVFMQCPKKTGFGTPLTLNVIIKNSGLLPLQNLRLDLMPVAYFAQAFEKTNTILEPNDKVGLKITLDPTFHSFDTIPDTIRMQITEIDPKSGLALSPVPCLQGNEVELNSEWFIKPFINYPPPCEEKNLDIPTLNLLMFGVIGSGKSSFLNAIMTSLLDQVQDPAVVGGNTSHVTREIRSFRLNQYEVLGDCRITLWDTWGLDETNYDSRLLVKILSGEIPDNFKMSDVNVFKNSSGPTISYKDKMARRIHGVFLFVPIGIREDPILTRRIKEILPQINQMNINATMIVTRADTVNDPYALQASIAQEFNLPQFKIKMVKNYTKEVDKTFAIDKKTLFLFQQAVQEAQSYVKFEIMAPVLDRDFVKTSEKNNRQTQNSSTHDMFTEFFGSQEPEQPRFQNQQPRFQNQQPRTQNHVQNNPERFPDNQEPPASSYLQYPKIVEAHSYMSASSPTSQMIKRLVLIDQANPDNKAQLRNVDPSISVEELLKRVEVELCEELSKMSVVGSSNQSDKIRGFISNQNDQEVLIYSLEPPSRAQVKKLWIVRNGERVGVIRGIDPQDSLSVLRQKIFNDLPHLSGRFHFLEEGVKIYEPQENGILVSELLSGDEIFIS